jgi:cAMP-dependent protein kinase regulator
MAKDDKRQREIRRLRDEATSLVEKSKFDKAIEKYLALEKLDLEDASWSKRAADCYRRLGRRQDELAALIRAADGYSRTGFLLKAVAMCKLVLAVDPNHTETLERMARLHTAQTSGLDRFQRSGSLGQVAPPVAAARTTPAPEPSLPELPEPPAPGFVEAPPVSLRHGGAALPLEAVALNQMVDSRLRLEVPAHSSGIYELNLDEIEYLDQSGAATEAPPEPAPAAVTRPSERVRATARELLPRIPLFSEVSEASLVLLVSRVSLRELPADTVVYREGDAADALYVIVEGAVEIVKEGPPRTSQAMLGEGDFFGEIGLVSDTPRLSSAVALQDTQFLVIDRTLVSELCEAEPAFLKVLLRFLRYRLIAPLLDTSPLFAPFSDEERKAMAKKFQFLELESGAVVIEEGRRAPGLFVLLSGEADVIRGGGERLATLAAGDVFGEMSLVTGRPAVGTVRTTKKCFALEMPAARFTETVMVNPQVLEYVSELADQRQRQNAGHASQRATALESRAMVAPAEKTGKGGVAVGYESG